MFIFWLHTIALSTMRSQKSCVAMSVLLPFELKKAHQKQIISTNHPSMSTNNQRTLLFHSMKKRAWQVCWRDACQCCYLMKSLTLHNSCFMFQIDITSIKRTCIPRIQIWTIFFQMWSHFNHGVTKFTFQMSVLLSKVSSFIIIIVVRNL